MSFTPVNGHIVINPVRHETFVMSNKETYDEIGVVLAVSEDIEDKPVSVGDSVYFDSWLAAKYPKEGSNDEFVWLVKWEDVRAVSYGEPKVSE